MPNARIVAGASAGNAAANRWSIAPRLMRLARSVGQSAGLPLAARGLISVTHSSVTSATHSQTVSTLRRLGGDPFIALPCRT
jgi:hypothetical protein